MAGRYDQKKTGPEKPGADQEQEQEVQQEQTQEQEQTRAQSTMGNQALAAMMNTRADPASSGTEGGGGGRSARRRKAPDKEGVDYGGDGDIDDVPISLEDLTASWNPGIRKSEDRPRYVEPMPDDDLPPEDPAFLEAVLHAAHSGPLPRLGNLDGLLQPSAEIVARSMGGWAAATQRWAAADPAWRAIAGLLHHQAPLLQTPDARVLPARAAIGAIASCMLAESPVLLASPSLETAALIEFCLELEGRAHRVDNVLNALDDQRSKLPRCHDLLSAQLIGGARQLREIEVEPGPHAALTAALSTLVRWEPLEDNVPPLRTETVPDLADEDPLGLDAVLNAELGGPRDPDSELYQVALQGAERLASAASLTRIRWTAAALLVAEVAALWTGPPTTDLLALASQVDEDVDAALKLLLEVARACQKRSVAPKGIHNGLRRGARTLDAVRARATAALATLCGRLLPGPSEASLPPPLRPDPMAHALQFGDPAECLPWLGALPPSLSRDVAIAVIEATAGTDPTPLAPRLRVLRDRALREDRPGPLATALTILHAHARRQLDELDDVIDDGQALQTVGRSRRNGLLVAEGALLEIEALIARDEPQQAAQVRLRAARLCLDLGARGGLSLLARWAPAAPEPEDFAPFFDYPMDFDDDEDEEG